MDNRKRAAIEFSVRWRSGRAAHNDRIFIDKVDFWRDIFPGSMGDALSKADNDQTHTETFDPGTLVPGYSEKKLVTFKKSEVAVTDNMARTNLEPGRYYPKGFFWKVLHSFPTDTTPVRLVESGRTTLIIDTNHPLARYPLTIEGRVHHSSTVPLQRGGILHDIAEEITTGGPGMQAAENETIYHLDTGQPLPRDDETDDVDYYQTPRLVHHIDETARHQVQALYGRILQPQTRVLDLMSSWDSHIPDSLASCRIEGLGLNEQELQANPRLSGYLIQDLNRQPVLPYLESSFDAVICTVSIEYICRPWRLFSEIARILKPGGIVAITVSERWFPGRQVHPWAELHPFERQGLVVGHVRDQTNFNSIQTESIRGYPRPRDDRYSNRMSGSDPLYFVWAVRR